MSVNEKLRISHREIYRNLYDTLRLLNKRLHLKIYAVVYGPKQTYIDTVRVRKTVSNSDAAGYEVNQESIEEFAHMFHEISVENEYGQDAKALYTGMRDLLHKEVRTYRQKPPESVEEKAMSNERGTKGSGPAKSNDFDILYAHAVSLDSVKKGYSAIYVLEIRNLDEVSKRTFYKFPQYSFLRMLLDYFFQDYFKRDISSKKYNENHTQFARRISRLFMGKMNGFLQLGNSLHEEESYENEIDPAYYIYDLQEKLDDISTQTYEGSSPFGSIVFCHRNLIMEKGQQNIQFAIKFIDDDKIKLDDAKRIRKLLELTDVKKELYLIADHQFVYGLGKVDWGKLRDHLTLRVDFKGLSRYVLQLVSLDESYQKNGDVLFHGDDKIYQTRALLKAEPLLQVSFKNPRLGEDGYSPEKLRNLLSMQFFSGNQQTEKDYAIEKLENIIQKAKEQKHGTMVVITEESVARAELSKLQKQSTLIEPSEIDADYIKHLTAIDGAIYFDIHGKCHGIGVILDGIAIPGDGDASRGARYNSAHRYLSKLKGQAEPVPCVIAVISEDGMVNLIPEVDNEDKIFGLVQEMIDIIKKRDKETIDELTSKESELNDYKTTDYHLYFKIARAFFNVDSYEKALEYCKLGFQLAGETDFVSAEYHNLKGDCHYFLDAKEHFEDAVVSYENAIKLTKKSKDLCNYYKNVAYSLTALVTRFGETSLDKINRVIYAVNTAFEIAERNQLEISTASCLNLRGLAYDNLSRQTSAKETKHQYLSNACEDYANAIGHDSDENVYFWNRSIALEQLGMKKEAIEDLIMAELLSPDETYRDKIENLMKNKKEYWPQAIKYYHEHREQYEEREAMSKLMEKYEKKMKEQNQEVPEAAPTKEES